MNRTEHPGELQSVTESLDVAAVGPSALLERVTEETGRAHAGRVELPSGRVVEARAESGGDRVTVRAASGVVELEVLMTERGPVLRFRAADIELASAGDVRVDCARFQVRAERGITQESGGDIDLTASGAATVRAREQFEVEARSARIEAKRGDVQIEANDDVKLLGERVKLNC